MQSYRKGSVTPLATQTAQLIALSLMSVLLQLIVTPAPVIDPSEYKCFSYLENEVAAGNVKTAGFERCYFTPTFSLDGFPIFLPL
jgi:hypothetical protein